jgi:hypothetical protein
MASISVPASAREATTRELRGLALFREHGSEITYEDGVWYVPSQHGATSVYEVVIGRKGESCECADFKYRGGIFACLHIYAATIARAKTGPCAECGRRFRGKDLYPVPEGDLTYFEGDELCHEHARSHGVL